MRVFVRHRTDYLYSVPVQLASHVLRLTPRPEGVLSLAQVLQVLPLPWTRREQRDAFGNPVVLLEFAGSSQTLSITNQLTVETREPAAPVDTSLLLPWRSWVGDNLALYRIDSEPDPSVQRFAADLASRVAMRALPFLELLTQTLFSRTQAQSRAQGDAQPAALTLASQRGSCRDVTALFNSACRSLGIACRFTSGYVAPSDHADVSRDMHAWPEVFLPAQGWRGWDPAIGRRVGSEHIALCSATTHHATLPVEGGYTYAGTDITTTLGFDLRISVS